MRLMATSITASCFLMIGCAANHVQPEQEMVASLSVKPDQLCSPKNVDRAVELDDSCINKISRSPTAGKGYNAVGRERKGLKSICRYSITPSCRKKY